VYRFLHTMALSILHRITGLWMALGLCTLVYWLASIAAGEDAYGRASTLLGAWYFRVLLLLWLAAYCYHFVNGLRHLAWDAGFGLEKLQARRTAKVVIESRACRTGAGYLRTARARGHRESASHCSRSTVGRGVGPAQRVRRCCWCRCRRGSWFAGTAAAADLPRCRSDRWRLNPVWRELLLWRCAGIARRAGGHRGLCARRRLFAAFCASAPTAAAGRGSCAGAPGAAERRRTNYQFIDHTHDVRGGRGRAGLRATLGLAEAGLTTA
jgi:succinate dehydrogenase / fumarate reductase cytochrome b subunit